MTSSYNKYKQDLLAQFKTYREENFAHLEELFDDKYFHVFKPEYAQHNLFNPELIELLPKRKRHRWFGSMGSSQALAVSIFGTLLNCNDLGILTQIEADDGTPLIDSLENAGELEFDYTATLFGEPRPTQVDFFISRKSGNVAIECKLWENGLEPCSQVKKRRCNGNYEEQPGCIKGKRCYLSERGVAYWGYIPDIFKWSSEVDHTPCPIRKPYQLVRNLLVASVDPENGKIKRRSTAILIYDSRNPAFAPEGETDVLFKNLKKSLKEPNLLKKISWQKLIPILIQSKEYKDLISWLNDKYKITPMFL